MPPAAVVTRLEEGRRVLSAEAGGCMAGAGGGGRHGLGLACGAGFIGSLGGGGGRLTWTALATAPDSHTLSV